MTRGRVRGGTLLAALVLVLTGCTWSAEEPGFFPSRPPTQTTSPLPPRPLETDNPELPVAGDMVWTSGDGQQVTSRYAVHAIRRLAGATVLDWSITPLSAPNVKVGDPLPSSTDLGLSTEAGGVNVLLVDGAGRKVYRPLSQGRAHFNQCLCTPLWAAQISMRMGETRLLQTTFPSVPTSTEFLDVDFVAMPMVTRVPLTAGDQVPTVGNVLDLGRAPFPREPLSGPSVVSATVDNVLQQRAFSLTIDSIRSDTDLTSVSWTIRSLRSVPRFGLAPIGPPISTALPNRLDNVVPYAASGPRLRAGDTTLNALWTTRQARGAGFVDCLCTTFGLWASSLREAGGTATVTTTYPGLPKGTTTVDVELPGAATLRGLGVVPATRAAARLGPPRAHEAPLWTYDASDPPRGWTPRDWPTPTPDLALLDTYEPVVDAIVPLPRS